MKNNYDIPATDTAKIKQLINRVKQGKLDQGDAQLIEKLLNFLLTLVSLLQLKNTSIRRMKELLFGMKEKRRGKDEAKNRVEEGRSIRARRKRNQMKDLSHPGNPSDDGQNYPRNVERIDR
jgi:hypothetical protein